MFCLLLSGCQTFPSYKTSDVGLLLGFLEVDTSDFGTPPLRSSNVRKIVGLQIEVQHLETEQRVILVASNKDNSFVVALPPGEYQILSLSTRTARGTGSPAFSKQMTGSEYFEIQAGKINSFGVFTWKLSRESKSGFYLQYTTNTAPSLAEIKIADSEWKDRDQIDLRLYKYYEKEKYFFPKK